MHVEWLSAGTFDGSRTGERLETEEMQQLKEANGIGLHPRGGFKTSHFIDKRGSYMGDGGPNQNRQQGSLYVQ